MTTYITSLKTLIRSTALAALIFGASACTNSRETLTDDAQEPTYENLSDVPGAYYVKASEEVREDKQQLRTELNEQLDKVDRQIEAVEDNAQRASASAREKYEQVIDEMDEEREKLVAEYKNIEDATDDAWMDVKRDTKNVIQDVDNAISELAASLD